MQIEDEWKLITNNPNAKLHEILTVSPIESLDYDNQVASPTKFNFTPGTYCNYSIKYKNCKPRGHPSEFIAALGLDPLTRSLDYSSHELIMNQEEDSDDKEEDPNAENIAPAAKLCYTFLNSSNNNPILATRYAWEGYTAHYFNHYVTLVKSFKSYFLLDYKVDNASCAGFFFSVEILERSSMLSFVKRFDEHICCELLKNNYKDQHFPKYHPYARVLDQGDDSESDVDDY